MYNVYYTLVTVEILVSNGNSGTQYTHVAIHRDEKRCGHADTVRKNLIGLLKSYTKLTALFLLLEVKNVWSKFTYRFVNYHSKL